jgi:hypothetical protein
LRIADPDFASRTEHIKTRQDEMRTPSVDEAMTSTSNPLDEMEARLRELRNLVSQPFSPNFKRSIAN